MKFIHSAVRVSAEKEAKAFYEELLCLNLVVEYKGERNLM
ncbi:MAG TPA: VOC family protein, partial [Thermoplasmata archaeon]|nr:VOC family protein [Thermoplasmata archaeon]